MTIIIRLDRMLADRKMQLSELAERVDVSIVNLSNLKTGKVRAVRFSTLNAICKALGCQPGDILEYVEEEDDGTAFYCLALTLKVIPIGTAYAIWAGLGTALTAIVGVVLYKERFNRKKVLGILCIILGVVVLNLAGGH